MSSKRANSSSTKPKAPGESAPKEKRPGRLLEAHAAKLFDRHPTPAVALVNRSQDEEEEAPLPGQRHRGPSWSVYLCVGRSRFVNTHSIRSVGL